LVDQRPVATKHMQTPPLDPDVADTSRREVARVVNPTAPRGRLKAIYRASDGGRSTVAGTCYVVARLLKATQSLNDPFRARTNLGNAMPHVGFPGTLTTSEGSRSRTHL
jgi:hypothetical protein